MLKLCYEVYLSSCCLLTHTTESELAPILEKSNKVCCCWLLRAGDAALHRSRALADTQQLARLCKLVHIGCDWDGI
jgi:hypothetical protein